MSGEMPLQQIKCVVVGDGYAVVFIIIIIIIFIYFSYSTLYTVKIFRRFYDKVPGYQFTCRKLGVSNFCV